MIRKTYPFIGLLLISFFFGCNQVERTGLNREQRRYVKEHEVCKCSLEQDYSTDLFVMLEELDLDKIDLKLNAINDSILGSGFISSSQHEDFVEKISDNNFKWKSILESGDALFDSEETKISSYIRYGIKELNPLQLDPKKMLNPTAPKFNLFENSITREKLTIKQNFYTCIHGVQEAAFGREAIQKDKRNFYYAFPTDLSIHYKIRIIDNENRDSIEEYNILLKRDTLMAYTKMALFNDFFQELPDNKLIISTEKI